MRLFKYVSKIEFAEPLVSASSTVPDWYKNIPPFIGGKPIIENYNKPNITVKNCIPFLESLTTGYMITTWQDMQVTSTEFGPKISWLIEPDPVSIRDPQPGLPIPKGHSSLHFAWSLPINYKTPKGYSVLIVHPLNRFDLPFTTLSGVIDSEDGMFGGQLPFFMHEGFEGIIPKGTPIAQIIPFKKENWIKETDESLIQTGRKIKYLSTSVLKGWYKKSVWKKVKYQ
jgi:hypothetical protein